MRASEDLVVRPPDLSADDIGLLGNVIAIVGKQWRSAVAAVSDEYSLSPRGVWILELIHSGRVDAQASLVAMFQCPPSVVSMELSKLREAGLIDTRKSDEDGRHVELRLTSLGKTTNKRVGRKLVKMAQERLAEYSRNDILLCASLLQSLAPRRRR